MVKWPDHHVEPITLVVWPQSRFIKMLSVSEDPYDNCTENTVSLTMVKKIVSASTPSESVLMNA